MKIRDIIEGLQTMDPDEQAAFHLVTHDQLHLAATAAGIDADCEDVDRGLVMYQMMLDFNIRSDPYRMLSALIRSMPEDGDEEQKKPLFH
jgi:hypothetical protein